jgi:hypothetical protein
MITELRIEEHTFITESVKCCAMSERFLKLWRMYQYFDPE